MFQDIPSGNPSAHPCLDKWLEWTNEAESCGDYTEKQQEAVHDWKACAVGFVPPRNSRLKDLGTGFTFAVMRKDFACCREIIGQIRAELTKGEDHMTKEQKFAELRKLIDNMPPRPEVITAQQMFAYYDAANKALKAISEDYIDNGHLAEQVLRVLSEKA